MGLHKLILSGSTFCLPSQGTFDLVLFFPHFIERNTILPMSHDITPVLPSACAELLGGGGGGSVSQSCPPLCDPVDCSAPGLPVSHHLPKFAQVHVHCIGDGL